MDKKTYTFDEACEYLNTSSTSLSDLIATGELPAAKISLRWVIRGASLDKYLADQERIQTEQRREAYLSGRVVKLKTAVAVARGGRRRVPPVLPDLPAELRGEQ